MKLRRVLLLLIATPAAAVAAWLGASAIVYGPEYVKRVLVWQDTDQNDYTYNFPQSHLAAASEPLPFGSGLDPSVVSGLSDAFGTDDFPAMLDRMQTEAFIVVQDDRVIFERYGTGAERASLLTSFSVAKAFVAMLIGIAIDEGAISGPDARIADYLPELADRDPRFDTITIRDLLLMSSGFEYAAFRWALFNGDDPLTSYYPDQRRIALANVRYARPPAEVFSYNKYHPQLLGLILERATGESVTEFTQTRLWNALGMEYGGSWSLDSQSSGFEKMEAGLNARAIDFAKFGRLFLNNGRAGERTVVSKYWMDEV